MSDSKTPLTDEANRKYQMPLHDYEFARGLERQISALKHDIEAYRGALGYSVSGSHDGRLVDGTIPQCGPCNSEYALNAKANYESWLNDSSLEKWFPITAEELNKLRAEVVALKRGEFICAKCGLRTDGEHGKGEF